MSYAKAGNGGSARFNRQDMTAGVAFDENQPVFGDANSRSEKATGFDAAATGEGRSVLPDLAQFQRTEEEAAKVAGKVGVTFETSSNMDPQEQYLNQLTSLVTRQADRKFGPREIASPPSSPQNPFPLQNEVRSQDRDESVSWLFEVFMEQSWPLRTFVKASRILDGFLGTCVIKRSQLQLLAVASTTLAASKSSDDDSDQIKECKLIEYTDNSVRSKEVRVSKSSLFCCEMDFGDNPRLAKVSHIFGSLKVCFCVSGLGNAHSVQAQLESLFRHCL